MADMFLNSPGIPTQDNQDGYNPMYDNITVQLRDNLNAQYEYVPTMLAPTFPAYIRSTGPGVGDENYNVGWKQVPVASGIIPEAEVGRYESPDLPVSHTPFSQAIYDSTLAKRQIGGQIIYSAMRSPGINEGF